MNLISITRKEDTTFAIQVRGHQVDCDLSVEDGGHEKGPSPSEMLVGSLGACIAIMVQIYCDRHNYNDGEVAVSLTYELADGPKRIGAITIDLEIPNDVPEDKYPVVKRIAESCPIHGSFVKPPEIDLEIV
jgi:putative redox protein